MSVYMLCICLYNNYLNCIIELFKTKLGMFLIHLNYTLKTNNIDRRIHVHVCNFNYVAVVSSVLQVLNISQQVTTSKTTSNEILVINGNASTLKWPFRSKSINFLRIFLNTLP